MIGNFDFNSLDTIKSTSFRLISNVFNFVLPPRCPLTGDIVAKNGMISSRSWKDINFIHAPLCVKCGRPFEVVETTTSLHCNTDIMLNDMQCGECLAFPPIYDQARAGLVYDHFSRDLILMFKHGDRTSLSRTLAPLMLRVAHELIYKADVILPVPLHRWRLLKRRYNQSAILAQSLKDITKIPVNPFILERIRATKSQGHMASKQRRKNVKLAFRVNPRYVDTIIGKNLILIDDVITTGATVNECAKVLKSSGAAIVNVLCVAKALK